MQNSVETIDKIALLHDNWDGDDSLSPSLEAIRVAKDIVYLLKGAGHEIYNVSPGPAGEIMLDLRFSGRMLEIIIYPDTIKLVEFSPSNSSLQGSVISDISLENIVGLINMEEE